MTDKEFCKIDTEFYGEVVDNIKQISLRNFNGEELKEYVEHCIKLNLLNISSVSQRSKQLKALINTGTDVELHSGFKARILDYAPETFLVQYNHNDHTDWIEHYNIKIESL